MRAILDRLNDIEDKLTTSAGRSMASDLPLSINHDTQEKQPFSANEGLFQGAGHRGSYIDTLHSLIQLLAHIICILTSYCSLRCQPTKYLSFINMY
jgi:hypothetical protein